MEKFNFRSLCPHLIGTYGQHWPEYGGGERIFLLGFFRTEATVLKISPLSAKKYISGSARFPRKLRSKYLAPDGDALLYANISRMISECPCASHLIEMQHGVYEFVCSRDLPHETYMWLVSLYIPDHPTADDIAQFLTGVLHAAILAS